MQSSLLDALWVLWGAMLVFVMQAGFLCLESGVTRSKNAINVAMKNLADFTVTVAVFWLMGFGLMFGESVGGWVGGSHFLLHLQVGQDAWLATFFLFEAMFCATATTIVSGAVAERMPFLAYLLITLVVGALVYPLFGHWAWASALGEHSGWLESLGFVDFAGSTVVHSLGGWVALAALLHIGPRAGRFTEGRPLKPVPASNLPLAMLGVLLLFLGWFGFNGGSTLSLDERVPGVLVNTVLGAVGGVLSGMLVGWRLRRYAEVTYAMNGAIAGLVAITAGAHAISAPQALFIGSVSGVMMVLASEALLRWRIDDAVGAIPAHLVAGIWGTLAVGMMGDLALLGTGLSRWEQIQVQCLGILVCAVWSGGGAWLIFTVTGRMLPLRVSPDAERLGLNMAEHGARSELYELLEAMRQHERNGNVHGRVEADPFTEVGEIAASYNRVASALEKAMARTQVLVRNLRDGVVTWRSDGTLTGLNPGAETLFGVSAEQLVGQPLSRLINGDLPQPGQRRELRIHDPRQGARYLELQFSEGATGSDAEYAAMVRDITDRKRVQEQLHRERDLAQVTLASIGDGVITTDEGGRVSFINAAAQRLTGWSHEEAVGQPIARIYQLVDESTDSPVTNPARWVLGGGQPPSHHEAHLLVSRSGEKCPVQDSVAPIRTRNGYIMGAVVVFHDMSITRDLSRKLNHQATHDALTGMANRRKFESELGSLVDRGMGQHVVCYLDLDQFKVVNDTCGHMAGDELLRQVAVLLRAGIRHSDLLARLGGDEFGIVFFECPLDKALAVAEAIREAIDDFRFVWEGRTFSIGVSLGLVAVTGVRRLSDVLSAADAACYAAKEAGRNRVHIYQRDDSVLLERRGELQWVPRLQAAIDSDSLRLYAQPIVAVGKGREVNHYEILVRLEEQGKVISPGAFMPAAERYSLMPRIDRWVVRNTLAWLADSVRCNRHCGLWSVNLSGASLSDERFCEDLRDWVAGAGLPPGTLCFEITESVAIAQLSRVTVLIKQLRALGCLFSLDDFGAGLSSFGYLKQLPVDFLKIDGRFVRDIHEDPIDCAMVEAINTVGHTLNLKTIAEFVESEAIMRQLERLGVDYAQGYLIDVPKPLETLGEVRVMPR
ncbi:ammonium transporter [Halomonas sp. McH1-25]|uniref:ammonium transporter n=1 Tax=unclassified Halomonas TaxID=2609666 RepID=UPI001EF6CCE3|nr:MULTISPECIES: ammonium transporter [unclassified Halomonas]MCG7600533.1 ammonium transporter [Halomonas sp. McH1-25]MCP1342000.1 ammonium transporter [Halomonas sp. FL8]MCP1362708.1 ammonium transporter [Halomonas sp. BBD45]